MHLQPRTFPDGRDGTVSGELALPEGFRAGHTPLLVLGHGAGNDMRNPLVCTVQQGVAASDTAAAVRFNFPYAERGRRAPDRATILEACYRSVLETLREELRPPRLFIGGKSLGGRMASHLAAAHVDVDGLIFLGYPLHRPGNPSKLRDEHLPRITAPMLFFAGTRDPLSKLDVLRDILDLLPAPITLHVIEDGDHSFNVLKRTGRTRDEVYEEIVQATVDWISARL